MDGLRHLLEGMKGDEPIRARFLGVLNVLIGRRIARPDGTVISTGLTWRELALLLKKARWPKEAVRQLGLAPEALPPRDRQRYWYAAITLAGVDAGPAAAAGDEVAALLPRLGYAVGPAPKGTS
jgi:hypothetical protein